MRILTYTFVFICVFLLYACALTKTKSSKATAILPELGSFAKAKHSLWTKTSEQIGFPKWEAEGLLIHLQEIPFTKKTYGTYVNYQQQLDNKPAIAYKDSLGHKAKYIQLQLRDKIGITHLINNTNNTTTRAYLEQDPGYGIITSVYLTIPDSERTKLLEAKKIHLKKDASQQVYIELQKNNARSTILLSELDFFGVEMASFCWGKNQFGKPMVKALLAEGEKCPKNTFKEVSKISVNKTYLKF